MLLYTPSSYFYTIYILYLDISSCRVYSYNWNVLLIDGRSRYMNKIIKEYMEKMHWDITRWQLGIRVSGNVQSENKKIVIDASGEEEGWI